MEAHRWQEIRARFGEVVDLGAEALEDPGRTGQSRESAHSPTATTT